VSGPDNLESKGAYLPQAIVSIGMPVFNASNYIRGALDSLLAQSHDDFDILISDNASSDSTGDICKEYAARDSRIRYVRQEENIGALENFRFVLQESCGRYFMWAAHDDRWKPNYIESLVNILESDPDCGLSFSNYIEMNLDTGSERFHKVRASNRSSSALNYMTRCVDMCPSLIYGLFRRAEISPKALDSSFDFSDVNFVLDLAIRRRIIILNDYLYTAGTKGVREPYSISHRKINRVAFIGKQHNLLFSKFSVPVATALFLFFCLVMAYNKIRLWRY
jgi:glycosyltransferase involved in cell wall biosynthesis